MNWRLSFAVLSLCLSQGVSGHPKKPVLSVSRHQGMFSCLVHNEKRTLIASQKQNPSQAGLATSAPSLRWVCLLPPGGGGCRDQARVCMHRASGQEWACVSPVGFRSTPWLPGAAALPLVILESAGGAGGCEWRCSLLWAVSTGLASVICFATCHSWASVDHLCRCTSSGGLLLLLS